MAPRRTKDKVPLPGAKNEPSTSFYTRKKWRALLQMSSLDVASRRLDARGALIVGAALLKNHYVTRLDLSSNMLGDDGAVVMADVLRGNTCLQWLNLSHNHITDRGGIALAGAFMPSVSAAGQPGQWNRTLFTIILLGNALRDDTLLAFSNAAACSRDLSCVDLAWNRVGPQGTRCLLRCYERNPVCNFVLAANRLGDEGAAHWCDALGRFGGKAHPTLNLYRNDLGYRGADAVGRLLVHNTFVQEVNLRSNTLGPRGAQELRRHLCIANCVVRVLDLSDNMLGDEGAVEVAAMVAADVPSLERLDVSHNNIADKGATALAHALKANTHLQVVLCHHNLFGARAVAAVEELIRGTKTLKSLNLSHCIDVAEQRRSLTLAVGEADGLHVELGAAVDVEDESKSMLNRLTEYLQQAQSSEEAAQAKEAKTPRRPRKATAA